jgi:hypothetical protein
MLPLVIKRDNFHLHSYSWISLQLLILPVLIGLIATHGQNADPPSSLHHISTIYRIVHITLIFIGLYRDILIFFNS